MLLAKQELAEKMGANDEKMLSMKLKYEEALKHMEEEIGQRLSQRCKKFDIFPHPFLLLLISLRIIRITEIYTSLNYLLAYTQQKNYMVLGHLKKKKTILDINKL